MFLSQEGKQNIKKMMFLIVLLSTLCAVLLESITWVTTPLISQEVVPEDAVNLYPEMPYYTNSYAIFGDRFSPNGIDPQLGFLLSGEKIQTIYFEFPEPLSQEMAIQTYYAVQGEELSEGNSLVCYASKGSTCFAFNLPEDNYTHLRFDIDNIFTLLRIAVSPRPTNIEYLRTEPNVIRVAATALFLIFISSIVQMCRKRNNAENMIRSYGWVILLSLMAALILLRVNNSSMVCYREIIPNNINAASMVSFGTPRTVRSDEYLVGGANFFHSGIIGRLSVPALTTSTSSIIVKLNNIITYLNPFFWGELFLTTEYAYSWNFLVKLFFAFYTFYRLFQIITGSMRFSITASLLLCFAPGFQWWAGPGVCGIWCGYITLFYDFFEKDRWWKKLLCSWGIVCCTSYVILSIYPPWDVPMIYLFAAILIGIYATKRKINFRKSDLCFIGGTILLMAVVVSSYFISQSGVIEAQLNSVYPGRRFKSGGGLDSIYWADYLIAPFMTWKPFTIAGTNESEISHFLHLFPIPTAIFIAKYHEFKNIKVMLYIVVFKIICAVYMVLGVGDLIAKYSLLSYSTPSRISTIWGLASFILLLLECYYIVPVTIEKLKKKEIISCAFINISVISFLVWVALAEKRLMEYMGEGFCYIAVGLVIVANLLFFGEKKIFIGILCGVTFVSGVLVNPINFGTGAITDTPLAMEIRKIDNIQKGKWIALNDYFLPKYVYAQGVDCLNCLSWPPRYDLFVPLDKTGEYEDIYNRYAHVLIRLVDEETNFVLLQSDLFQLNMNINDIKKWDVQYIVSQGQQLESRNSVGFAMIYHDLLDDIYIYEVNY